MCHLPDDFALIANSAVASTSIIIKLIALIYSNSTTVFYGFQLVDTIVGLFLSFLASS